MKVGVYLHGLKFSSKLGEVGLVCCERSIYVN